MKPLLFLAFGVWALFSLSSCNGAKTCQIGYQLPSGVTCTAWGSLGWGHFKFYACSDGFQYLDPPSWREISICEGK